MRVQAFERRIERAEQAAKANSRFAPECLCFPENESPFFAFEIELEMLTQVKCSLNGSHLALLGPKPLRHETWTRKSQ
jgi:hypothetical protein